MDQLNPLLAIIPLSCYFLAKTYKPQLKWLLTGIFFGLVIDPFSLSLAKSLNLPFIGKMFGLAGMFINLIHESIGQLMLSTIGFTDAGVVVDAHELMVIHLVNGIIWAFYYGIIGYCFDRNISINREFDRLNAEFRKA